jgi:chromosome segregation ATPase
VDTQTQVSLTRQEVEQIKNGFVLITEVQRAADIRITKLEAALNQSQSQDSDVAKQLARLTVILDQVQTRSIEQKDALSMIPDINYKISTLTKEFDEHKTEGKELSKEQATKFNSLQNGLIVAGFSVFLAFLGSQIFPYLHFNRTSPTVHVNPVTK